jgi:hypothetical protein
MAALDAIAARSPVIMGEAAAKAEPRRLRVGLFVDSRLQPRWVIEAFARVAQAGFAEVVLIAVAAPGAAAAAPRDSLLWKLYSRADRWAFDRGPDPGETADLVAGVPHRHFTELRRMEPLAHRTPNLDVAFALGGFDEALLEGTARHGVWRFYFGGFREVAANEPITGSGLIVRLAGGAQRLAYESWSRTYPFSAARNRAQVLLKTAEFACRALRELHRSGPAWIEHSRLVEPVWEKKNFVKTTGALGDIAAISARIAARGVEKALNVEQWFLAYRFVAPGADDARGGPDDARVVPANLEGFTRLLPPKDRYWADPFVLERNGRYFVFFEELPFKSGKAHISMIEVAGDGTASTPVKVLERDYHLSYPFILEHEGQLYMIPETGRNGTVELYRCIDFPLRWKLERTLLDGLRCVDATFHRGAGRWWMFANAAAPGSRMFDDELHLFHAEDLFGEWRAHPGNPVKSDARCARPAGRLYWKNGALYRPAQICAPLYGSGLSINRVLRLTPHEYAERQVERVLPSLRDGLLGVHTINRAGSLTVVDAFTRRPRF